MTKQIKNDRVYRRYVYRSGYPRVTEALSRHYEDRGTGHEGTGIYAYKTKKAALPRMNDPVYQIDVTGIKFFNPDKGLLRYFVYRNPNSALKGLSESMNWAAIGQILDKKEWYGESIKMQIGMASVRGDSFGFTREEIETAIEKSVVEGKAHGIKYASQPINHLLIAKGFGGVDPGKPFNDMTALGIVIFKEIYGLKAKDGENVKIPIVAVFNK